MNVDQIIQTYGPTVWAAAQRQVQVDIHVDEFVLIACAIAFVPVIAAAVFSAVKSNKAGPYSDWAMLSGILGFLAVGLVILALIDAGDLYQITQNPVGRAISHVHDYVSPSS